MKNLSTLLLAGALCLGAVACADNDSAKTSANSPNSAQDTPGALEPDQVQDNQADAQSDVRRNQLNSDIRANEQRNNASNSGSEQNRNDDSLATEVRSKLEANIPASALVVEAEEGAITVSGTVPTQEQLDKIEPLAKEIKGVQSVSVKAVVAQAQPENDKPGQ